MKQGKRNDYVTRDILMKLLSDEEVARVSTAETEARLPAGDEFIDLKRLDRGVQQAHGKAPMNRVLPRKAVEEATWNKILTRLAESKATTAHHRA